MRRIIQLLKLSRRRWRHRKDYGSAIDVVKAAHLQTTYADWRKSKPADDDGLWIRAAQVKDPLWLRRRSSDVLVFQEIFEKGEYRPIQRWKLPQDATVLDMGGNVGLATVYFISVLPAARVVVVEPDHANCQSIARTCGRQIASGNVRVVEAFVAAQDGSAWIDRTWPSWAFSMTDRPPDGGGERIACVSVPTLIRESGFAQIDLLKCDIEGTEAEVFAQCTEWIGKVNHLVVETHAPYRIAQLFRHLDQAQWAFESLWLHEDEKIGLAFLRRSEPPPDPAINSERV